MGINIILTIRSVIGSVSHIVRLDNLRCDLAYLNYFFKYKQLKCAKVFNEVSVL